ncbi:MAG: hypothetical protein K6L80_14235 [Agarilytica sp.]
MKKRNLITSCLNEIPTSPVKIGKFCLAVAATGLLLSGCGGSDTDATAGGNTLSTVNFDLELPDSVTGGQTTDSRKTTASVFAKTAGYVMGERAKPGDLPCSYMGSDNEDPFENGYEATKFMVSAIAVWGCVADLLIDITEQVPHDGSMIETENDVNADNYEVDEPTHYAVVDDSDIQTTVRLYYGYDRELPPSLEDEAGFYLSWTEDRDGTLRGRLIIAASALEEEQNPDDPTQMRMDFREDDEEKVHDMYLRFSDENPWADGLRIRVTKNLTANSLEEVFTAQGLMAMSAQFIPVEGIAELPEIAFYSVANQLGDGASIAQINNMSLAIPLNAESNLGTYLMSKEDIYFFDDDQSAAEPWDWINKEFTTALYKGGRTAPETDGTWVPFNPSLDMVETALELDEGYFANTCADIDDNCTALINGVFLDGFADQQPNQGEDPNDWRSLSLQSATYLDTVYPNSVDWTNAFDQAFQP